MTTTMIHPMPAGTKVWAQRYSTHFFATVLKSNLIRTVDGVFVDYKVKDSHGSTWWTNGETTSPATAEEIERLG